ncbi:unnamed protein product, partial [Polarella glacialis]
AATSPASSRTLGCCCREACMTFGGHCQPVRQDMLANNNNNNSNNHSKNPKAAVTLPLQPRST